MIMGAASTWPPRSSSTSCRFPGDACLTICQFMRPLGLAQICTRRPSLKRASRRNWRKTVTVMVTDARPVWSLRPSCRTTDVVL